MAFRIEVSSDGTTWRNVHETVSGAGGVVEIRLATPVAGRWVRMTATKRSNANPLRLNGFQVDGMCGSERPAARGWTAWGMSHGQVPELRVGSDGTVPVESGWALTMDDFVTDDGVALSGPSVDVSGWLPATVVGAENPIHKL